MIIRLACLYCDTEEADGVREIPAVWNDIYKYTVDEIEESGPGEWWNHTGVCRECAIAMREQESSAKTGMLFDLT